MVRQQTVMRVLYDYQLLSLAWGHGLIVDSTAEEAKPRRLGHDTAHLSVPKELVYSLSGSTLAVESDLHYHQGGQVHTAAVYIEHYDNQI